MAARQTIRTSVRSSTNTRVRRNGMPNASGYQQCNMCKGTGIVRKGK